MSICYNYNKVRVKHKWGYVFIISEEEYLKLKKDDEI